MLQALALSAAATITAPACATDYHWSVPSGTWNNGPNWSPVGEPGPGDNAHIDYPFNATVAVIGSVPSPNIVTIEDGDAVTVTGTQTQEGFLAAGNTLYVGFGQPGILNVIRGNRLLPGAGHVSTPFLVVGNGTVNQSAGTVAASESMHIVGDNENPGVYRQSGGDLTVTKGLTLANGGTMSNQVAFSLTGGSTNVGGLSDLGGDVTQTGGVMTLADQLTGGLGLSLSGNSGVGFSVPGHYLMQGGTLSCTGGASIGLGGTLSYSGGALSFAALSVANLGQVQLTGGGGKVLRCTAADVVTGGIDLSDNAMIVDYTGASPLASISAMIGSGTYSAVTGLASGIVSTTAINGGLGHPTALGIAEASALGVSTFEGQSVDDTSVLVRYIYSGDANLDGKVDTLDFNSLAANFGGSAKVWTQGDFNYDGVIDTLDFNNLAANFGQQLPGDSVAVNALLPEPGSAWLLASGALATLYRSRRLRRRRREPGGPPRSTSPGPRI